MMRNAVKPVRQLCIRKETIRNYISVYGRGRGWSSQWHEFVLGIWVQSCSVSGWILMQRGYHLAALNFGLLFVVAVMEHIYLYHPDYKCLVVFSLLKK